MKIVPAALPDICIVYPAVFHDERGQFCETWNARTFAAQGIDYRFVQDNWSRSRKNVLRGLHYQVKNPQGKLLRISAGRAFSVAVDLRRSSPHFSQWFAIALSVETAQMLWVPPGFAHGFMALEDNTDLLYKCTEFYAPEDERTLLWNDPALNIAWPMVNPVLNTRDSNGVRLSEAETFP